MDRSKYETAVSFTKKFRTIAAGVSLDDPSFECWPDRWIENALKDGRVREKSAGKAKIAPLPDGASPSPSDTPASDAVPQPASERTSPSRNTSRKS